MKTKNMFFLLCLGLGVTIFVTSCDSKKESFNFSDNMQKYLIQRENGVVNIFVKNDKNKCYDSLTQFPAPKYAEITNGQIAYILDHPDQSLVEEQTYADYYFDGVLLTYTKIELTYILEHNDVWNQKEINNKEKSGIVWSWIIGLGLFFLGLFVYCIIHCWLLIKRKEMSQNCNFIGIYVFGTPTIIVLSMFIENFLETYWLILPIAIILAVIFIVMIFVLLGIDDVFEKTRIRLVNRDVEKTMKKEKNN